MNGTPAPGADLLGIPELCPHCHGDSTPPAETPQHYSCSSSQVHGHHAAAAGTTAKRAEHAISRNQELLLSPQHKSDSHSPTCRKLACRSEFGTCRKLISPPFLEPPPLWRSAAPPLPPPLVPCSPLGFVQGTNSACFASV